MERLLIVTNNPLSLGKFSDKHSVVFVEGDIMDVLRVVRDYVHLGHKVLTHPLSSSVKPNETPYRTVALSRKNDKIIHIDSLDIIENALIATEKFMKSFQEPSWTEIVLKDFQLIDYDIINNAIN